MPVRKRLSLTGFLLLLALLEAAVLMWLLRSSPRGGQVAALPAVEVYFSPKGGCTEAVVRELRAAKASILLQAYSFTSLPIAEAVVEAHRRGVHVEALIDRGQDTARYNPTDFLTNAGVPTLIDSAHAIAHNKIMIIDEGTVITGSFNFTRAAEERNAENLLILRDRELAAAYTANWEKHKAHSKPPQNVQPGETKDDAE